jgi:hypothetical protein
MWWGCPVRYPVVPTVPSGSMKGASRWVCYIIRPEQSQHLPLGVSPVRGAGIPAGRVLEIQWLHLCACALESGHIGYTIIELCHCRRDTVMQRQRDTFCLQTMKEHQGIGFARSSCCKCSCAHATNVMQSHLCSATSAHLLRS